KRQRALQGQERLAGSRHPLYDNAVLHVQAFEHLGLVLSELEQPLSGTVDIRAYGLKAPETRHQAVLDQHPELVWAKHTLVRRPSLVRGVDCLLQIWQV